MVIAVYSKDLKQKYCRIVYTVPRFLRFSSLLVPQQVCSQRQVILSSPSADKSSGFLRRLWIYPRGISGNFVLECRRRQTVETDFRSILGSRRSGNSSCVAPVS